MREMVGKTCQCVCVCVLKNSYSWRVTTNTAHIQLYTIITNIYYICIGMRNSKYQVVCVRRLFAFLATRRRRTLFLYIAVHCISYIETTTTTLSFHFTIHPPPVHLLRRSTQLCTRAETFIQSYLYLEIFEILLSGTAQRRRHTFQLNGKVNEKKRRRKLK